LVDRGWEWSGAEGGAGSSILGGLENSPVGPNGGFLVGKRLLPFYTVMAFVKDSSFRPLLGPFYRCLDLHGLPFGMLFWAAVRELYESWTFGGSGELVTHHFCGSDLGCWAVTERVIL